jgi:hypothetical protein
MEILPSRPPSRRLALLMGVLVALFAYYMLRTWWWPDRVLETAHYAVRSDATPEQTQTVADALEALHTAYYEVFSDLPGLDREHERLVVNLYRDRAQFRRCHPKVTWAEALYARGKCHAYYGVEGLAPYQWMLHEATHQLNDLAAHLSIPQWINEGIAEYFGTGRYADGVLQPGEPDPDAYPVSCIYDVGFSGDLEEDLGAGRVIPLRAIVTGEGGPDMDEKFSLYYLHWWSITDYLMKHDGGALRPAYFRLMRDSRGLKPFERHIGPVDEVQRAWYEHLLELKRQLTAPPASPPAPS